MCYDTANNTIFVTVHLDCMQGERRYWFLAGVVVNDLKCEEEIRC